MYARDHAQIMLLFVYTTTRNCSITLSHSIGNKNNGILQELDGIISLVICPNSNTFPCLKAQVIIRIWSKHT